MPPGLDTPRVRSLGDLGPHCTAGAKRPDIQSRISHDAVRHLAAASRTRPAEVAGRSENTEDGRPRPRGYVRQSVFARDCAALGRSRESRVFATCRDGRMPRLREIRASSYSSRMLLFVLARVCENAAKRGLSRRIAAAEILTCSNCPAPCRFCTLHRENFPSRRNRLARSPIPFDSPLWTRACSGVSRRSKKMLWTIFVVLLVLWALGMVTSYTAGGLIHLLLAIALIVLVFRLFQGRRIV